VTPPLFRLLVVGVGSIGERHVRCFQATGRVEVSICEIQSALRETVAERYGIGRAYADMPSALSDSHDAVVIATPAPLHIPQATAAVRAGYHVLIEKPLSTTRDGVAELKQLAGLRKVVTAVAYVYRAHPVLAAMRDALHSGRFGRPLQVVVVSGQHFPHYRPAYRATYYRDRATGGGAIQDALTHTVNAAEWIVGPIDSLAADAAHQLLDGVDVEDTVHVVARHGNVMGSYCLNQHQAPNETTITVVCERGTTRFEYQQNRWRWQIDPADTWHDEIGLPLQRDQLFTRQANLFLDAIQQGSPPSCTLEGGAQTLAVNLAILAAVQERRWVEVDRSL
jgi:predicted dehydrogenase